MRDSRKLFRLGKGINELNFIIDKFAYDLSYKFNSQGYLELSMKLFYFIYWLFDNIAILSKLKLLSFDVKATTKYAATGWFIGTILSTIKLLFELNNLLVLKNKEDPNNKDPALNKKIFNTYINIIGKIGDIFPSSQLLELPQKVMGRGWSETTVGIGGFIAALVALKNAWK
jgi:hypothetical protein